MLTIYGESAFELLYSECSELEYIIKALLEIAANEMFFGEFLWDGLSAISSLYETEKLLSNFAIEV